MRKGGYDFYLNKCLLPVTPQQLQIKINNANKTVTLINEGQINVLKRAELTDVEFECEIPQVKYPYAVYKSGFQGAAYFLDYFEELKNKKKPFQFIVVRTLPTGKVLFSTNLKVTMEDYKITEKAQNGFDLAVKIKLKQWRDYGTKTVNMQMGASVPKAIVEQPRAAETSPAPASTQTYTVEKGDCLWNIAKKIYGNGAKYTVIANANKDKIQNPNLIYPSQVLTIPVT